MIKVLFKNSTSNVIVLFIKLIISFIMSPVIVKSLGNYDYGVWELMMSVIGYVGILDMGMQPAIVRYVARYNALNDIESLHKLYSTSIMFLLIIGCIGFAILSSWAVNNPGSLSESGSVTSKYSITLILLGIQMLFKFPGYAAECFQLGYQRYTFRNTINILLTIIASSVIIYMLSKGHALITLAVIATIETIIKTSAHVFIISRCKYGRYIFSKKHISWRSLVEPITFGCKSSINYISGILAISTDSIVIAAFLGPIIVTYYSISAKLVLTVCSLLGALSLALMPFFSNLDAQGDKDRVVIAMTKISKYLAGVMVPILLALCFLGVPFVSRWMGPEYAANGRIVLYALVGANIMFYVNPCHNHFLTGIGSHGFLAKINLLSSVLNLILSLILVRFYGKEGVALGTLMASLIFSPIVLAYTCKCLGISILKYVKQVLVPLIVPNTIFIVCLWIITSILQLASYSSIAAVALISYIIYICTYYLVALECDEREYIYQKTRNYCYKIRNCFV